MTSEPESNALVFVNGERVGYTPYKSGMLQSGDYKVRVEKEMYESSEQLYVVKDNETTVAGVTLRPNFANVTVNTDAESDIYLDNEFRARGVWNGRVSEGTHYFEARKQNHRTTYEKVILKKGELVTINIADPQPINGHLDINTVPIKADIYIDGVHYGKTPRIIPDVLIGNHKLRIEKEDCAPLTKDIDEEQFTIFN